YRVDVLVHLVEHLDVLAAVTGGEVDEPDEFVGDRAEAVVGALPCLGQLLDQLGVVRVFDVGDGRGPFVHGVHQADGGRGHQVVGGSGQEALVDGVDRESRGEDQPQDHQGRGGDHDHRADAGGDAAPTSLGYCLHGSPVDPR